MVLHHLQRLVFGICLSSWAFVELAVAAEPAEKDSPSTAQPTESPAASPTATPAANAEKESIQKQFDDVFAQWKVALKEIRTLQVKYQVAVGAEKAKLESQFPDALAKARKLIPQLKSTAEKAYVLSPNENEDVAQFMAAQLFDHINTDSYEEAFRMTELLIDHEAKVERLQLMAGVAAFATANYERADEHFKVAAATDQFKVPEKASEHQKRILEAAQTYATLTGLYKKLWAEEQKIRAEEAEANDLPRVKLQTTKGDIVVELFENQAPNTTANFISLVKKGFYDGLKFHRVISGFVAQGGCPRGDGTGGPGYAIECECDRTDHRKHFRGTLSMAHSGPNTGGSQFFLSFVPTLPLDGKHTVFGRVIEGMEVLSQLHRIEPGKAGEADKIIKATVVRKRDHDYTPKTIAARK